MGIEAVSHIAVGVRDMDPVLGFYRDVLGMHVTADEVEDFSQGAVQVIAGIVGVPGEDYPMFQQWAEDITSIHPDPERAIAGVACELNPR